MYDAEWAFRRYEAVRDRLPHAEFSGQPKAVTDLSDTFADYDAYILDAYGVLNFGDTVIPGAVERIAQMRAAGKRVVVLTNGASFPRENSLRKYVKYGFDFTAEEVVSSRDVAAAGLKTWPTDMLWAGITATGAGFEDLPARIQNIEEDETLYERADGFLFLGALNWDDVKQERLSAALRDRPRPVIVANPDIVAPREGDFSLEPGYYAHELPVWQTGPNPQFYGKPFLPAFEAALAALGKVDPKRVAMVGDTLHTDVLGGRAAGVGTILIAGHGLFRGLDAMDYVNRSGIIPDVIAQTT